MTPDADGQVARTELSDRRAEVGRRIERLRHEVDDIVTAAGSSNSDDEHDPEGATIAFEREQVNALLAGANRALVEIDEAISRLERGSYGRCVECGNPIDPQRLDARPAADRCIGCARRS